MWRQRTGRDDFVPALTGGDNGMGEYQDWDKPGVMERRAALRERFDRGELSGCQALRRILP
jgi:hypothetical protein